MRRLNGSLRGLTLLALTSRRRSLVPGLPGRGPLRIGLVRRRLERGRLLHRRLKRGRCRWPRCRGRPGRTRPTWRLLHRRLLNRRRRLEGPRRRWCGRPGRTWLRGRRGRPRGGGTREHRPARRRVLPSGPLAGPGRASTGQVLDPLQVLVVVAVARRRRVSRRRCLVAVLRPARAARATTALRLLLRAAVLRPLAADRIRTGRLLGERPPRWCLPGGGWAGRRVLGDRSRRVLERTDVAGVGPCLVWLAVRPPQFLLLLRPSSAH